MLICLFCLLIPLVFSREELHSEHNFGAEEIIDLPVGRFPDPECQYTVRRGRRNGPTASGQVHVGDQLYHQWSCNYGNNDPTMYCLMVNNCTVSAEKHSNVRVPILDEFGCSLFPSVLPHVHYTADLEGGLLVHAFSLDIDKAAVFFECNIKLLLKLNGVCRRPNCQPLEVFQEENRRKRNKFTLRVK